MATTSYINFVLRRYISKTAARLGGASKGHGDGHGEAGVKFWRNMTFFVGFPCIGLGMVNAYLGHVEHEKHPRAEFVAYEHLRLRSKAFPWGDGNRTLFHNPEKNALPKGFEAPDPNAGKAH